jgi:hypothetical protein
MNPIDLYIDQLDRLREAVSRSCELARRSLRTAPALEKAREAVGQDTSHAEAPDLAPRPDPHTRLDDQAAHAIAAHLEADSKEAVLPKTDLPKKPTGLELND